MLFRSVATKTGVTTIMKTTVDLGAKKGSLFDKGFVTVNDWNLIKVSNYYNHYVDLGEVKGTLELPGYVYYQTGKTGEDDEITTELSLIATSPDVASFGNFTNDNSDYTTPGYLYLDGERYTDKGTDATNIKVTSIGNYAFGVVPFNNINEFIIAKTVTTLSDFALAGYAPIYISDTGLSNYVVTLNDVYCLNLSEVETIGKKACYRASIVRLKSKKLSWMGVSAFEDCKLLQKVFLPAYVNADSTGSTFKNCWALTEVTFGKNTKSLAQKMFDSCSNLQKITILKDDAVLSSCPTSLFSSSSAGAKITLSVPKSVLAGYQSNFKNGFGYIPKDNFESFENASTYDDITYYWNVVSDVDDNRTAYIDYIYATSFDSELTIPSKVQREDESGNKIGPEYTVIFVAAQAMKTLDSNVSTVVLPSGMQYLTFSTEDLADTVTTLVISSDNSKFGTTSEGVLYGKDADGDLTTLLVYPKAKAATEVTLASTVTEIASGAFYGAKNLKTLNIGGNVTIYDRAFEGSSISTINFTKTTGVSVFAGRDIFKGVNLSALNIFVPSGTLESYKANVLVDYAIIGCFKVS